MEEAKALGSSFKLVTLAPRTVKEMTQLPKETQKNGDTNKSKRNTINQHNKSTLRPGLYGDDPLATVRLPQSGLSSQSLGK